MNELRLRLGGIGNCASRQRRAFRHWDPRASPWRRIVEPIEMRGRDGTNGPRVVEIDERPRITPKRFDQGDGLGRRNIDEDRLRRVEVSSCQAHPVLLKAVANERIAA